MGCLAGDAACPRLDAADEIDAFLGRGDGTDQQA
jgi:hypothetical protein